MGRVPQASAPDSLPSGFGDSVEIDPDDITQVADPNDVDSAGRWVGRTIADKYQLEKVLGLGGMGAVYAARHSMTARRVAVKVMHAELARSSQHVARFLREAKSASAIGHPSIVDVLDAGRAEGGRIFLVMELLEGADLEDALRRRTLTGDEIVDIVIQLLDGLSAAHERGVVHRDIKPENIFVERDEQGRPRAKVLDFGIAKHLRVEPDQSTTRTGTIVGTPEFMSPEQAKGEAIDGRTDLWSTGAVLFYALTGRPPFVADNYNKLIVKLLTEKVPSIGEVRSDLPAELVRIVDRALAADRDQRWATAREMADALRALLAGAPPPIESPPKPGLRIPNQASAHISGDAATLMESAERALPVAAMGPTLPQQTTARVQVALPARSRALVLALVAVAAVAVGAVAYALSLTPGPAPQASKPPAVTAPASPTAPTASVAPPASVPPPPGQSTPHGPGATAVVAPPETPVVPEAPTPRIRVSRPPRKNTPAPGVEPAAPPPTPTPRPAKVPIGPTRNYD